MNILGIDTSTLYQTSAGCIFPPDEAAEIKLNAPFGQEENLLFTVNCMLDTLKKKINDIDIIAVGVGPGSFTGLRIGISTAKALSFSLKKKIIGISSLELLALSIDKRLIKHQEPEEALIVPVIDARMKKVFSAIFTNSGRIFNDMDIEPENLAGIIAGRPEKYIYLLGDGLKNYSQLFSDIKGKITVLIEDAIISGAVICRIAGEIFNKNPDDSFNYEDIKPVYIRESEAESSLNIR